MPDPVIVTGTIWEEANPTFLGVILSDDDSLPQASTLVPFTGVAGTGWDLYVYDLSANEATAVPNPTTAIFTLLGQDPGNGTTGPLFNSYQLGSIWKEDSIGYNWRYRLDVSQAGLVMEGGHVYRCEFTLNRSAANGGPAPGIFQPTVLARLSA